MRKQIKLILAMLLTAFEKEVIRANCFVTTYDTIKTMTMDYAMNIIGEDEL